MLCFTYVDRYHVYLVVRLSLSQAKIVNVSDSNYTVILIGKEEFLSLYVGFMNSLIDIQDMTINISSNNEYRHYKGKLEIFTLSKH